MNVIVRIQFRKPAEADWQAMRSLAIQLTNDRECVRVTADPDASGWLVAEFTMRRMNGWEMPTCFRADGCSVRGLSGH